MSFLSRILQLTNNKQPWDLSLSYPRYAPDLWLWNVSSYDRNLGRSWIPLHVSVMVYRWDDTPPPRHMASNPEYWPRFLILMHIAASAIKTRWSSNKHETLSQCWVNAGPSGPALTRHWANVSCLLPVTSGPRTLGHTEVTLSLKSLW